MNALPEKSPEDKYSEMLSRLSEQEVYDFVHQNHLFKKLDHMPLVAQKYYTYVINNKIRIMHKNKKLTTMFHTVTKPTSQEEQKLKELLPSQTAAKHLTRLNITFLKDEEIATIVKHLPEKLEYLTEINLAHTYITPKDLQILLQKCPNLKNLILTHNEADHTNSLTGKDFLQILKLFPNIKKIELHNKHFDKLKYLDTHGIKLDQLEFFYLSNAPISGRDFVHILQSCPNIKEAEFNRCKNLQNLDQEEFPKLEKLETIHLIEDPHLKPQDLIAIAQNCPHLKKIYITRTASLPLEDIPFDIKQKISWR